MAVYEYKGKEFIFVDEIREGGCDGCAMQGNGDCLSFRRMYPSFSCISSDSIVVELKGEGNATTQED